MLSREELKKIYLLQRLTDSMLEKVQSIAQAQTFEDHEAIFKEGEKAEYFYMLYKGKVLLEVEASEAITISLGSIKPGFSFGWSALLPGSDYTTHAICVEPSEVLCVPNWKFLDLLEEDHSMGYRVMQGAVSILEKRLERRTEQFLKTLRMHPDIKKPFWE